VQEYEEDYKTVEYVQPPPSPHLLSLAHATASR
jgi:hypothetical protein